MTQSIDQKTTRNHYPDEFREHALALALRVGVAKAAKELNLYESQLYQLVAGLLTGWNLSAAPVPTEICVCSGCSPKILIL